jgi:hypothetical protein
VTIAGGPGWQVDDPSPDVIGTDPGRGPGWRPSRGLVAAVAVSALVGFAAATGLAVWRHDRAGEIAAATLSVTVWTSGNGGFGEPVAVEAGRPALRIPVELMNTGPRDIELLSLRLVGTDVATGDVGAQRLTPGTRARAVQLRPVDCAAVPRQLAVDGDAARVAVRARTDAGLREVEVRAALNTGLLSREFVVAICGDLPPDEALMNEVMQTTFDGATALLSLQVGNGSRYRLTVQRVTPVKAWLSARFVDERGRPLPLPISLPAADFSTPRPPWDLRQRETWWVAVAVPDCRGVPSTIIPDGEEQLLRVDVDTGERSATVGLGGGSYDVLQDLVRRACPT